MEPPERSVRFRRLGLEWLASDQGLETGKVLFQLVGRLKRTSLRERAGCSDSLAESIGFRRQKVMVTILIDPLPSRRAAGAAR
jgi:hypothetical protein